jgi:hypothetical protein
MVAATALKIRHRAHLQWHDLPTEFHKNLPTDSEADGGQTHKQDGDLKSLYFSYRKESRLKITSNMVKSTCTRFPSNNCFNNALKRDIIQLIVKLMDLLTCSLPMLFQ